MPQKSTIEFAANFIHMCDSFCIEDEQKKSTHQHPSLLSIENDQNQIYGAFFSANFKLQILTAYRDKIKTGKQFKRIHTDSNVNPSFFPCIVYTKIQQRRTIATSDNVKTMQCHISRQQSVAYDTACVRYTQRQGVVDCNCADQCVDFLLFYFWLDFILTFVLCT